MNGEEDFHVENTDKTERSHNDICVLLFHSNATALMNMSETLRKHGYRVVATRRADELLLIINNEKIDLVLAEFRLIEMNKYELLEKVKSLCEIPIVVAGKYVKDAPIFYCLYRGASFHLKKPFMDNFLENLWQFKVWAHEEFLCRIESDPLEEKCSITHTQPLGFELKGDNQNNEVKTEDLDEYEGDNFLSGDQKKPELIGLEMQNEFRQTDDEHSKGNKRKERADTYTGEHAEKDYSSDLGDQKKPKLVFADNMQIKTLEAIPNIEEANNGRVEPTETKKNGEGGEKEKPELLCMEEEVEKWSTQPVTDFAAYVAYEFEELDFQPLESVGESMGHGEVPLSPRESSNKEAVGRLQMQNPRRALDEELRQDGISLSDLDFDLQEGQGSTSDLELLDEIYTDLAKELKP